MDSESKFKKKSISQGVDKIANLINNGKAKRIVVMTGAGISTSSGIPDFRSPETGLYANLARLDLPYAEAVFDISYFRRNPLPFYTLAHELYPGKYRPTITHSFIRLLNDKGLLLKHFTQNVDCLDRQAGVPDSMIVEAHGSFANQSCIECRSPFPHDLMEKAVKTKQVPHCLQKSCGGLVKPDIVFFGEALPPLFHASRFSVGEADLCFVMGTSLTVQPFASLPQLVDEDAQRVLLNQECVGSFGSRPADILLLGDCDDAVRDIAKACGWLEELERLWAATTLVKTQKEKQEQAEHMSRDELLETDVDRLTRDIDQVLKISRDHKVGTAADLTKRSEMKERAEDALLEQHLAHVFPHLKKPSL